jgi:hypothetical protein
MDSMSSVTLSLPKVDVEELIKEFKVLNIDMFSSYLKEIWRVNKNFNFLYFNEIILVFIKKVVSIFLNQNFFKSHIKKKI